jgi:uncharacterized protein with PIN domain
MVAIDTSALVAITLNEKQADACIRALRNGSVASFAIGKTAFPPATNQPDGQITTNHQKSVQPLSKKYFCFTETKSRL